MLSYQQIEKECCICCDGRKIWETLIILSVRKIWHRSLFLTQEEKIDSFEGNKCANYNWCCYFHHLCTSSSFIFNSSFCPESMIHISDASHLKYWKHMNLSRHDSVPFCFMRKKKNSMTVNSLNRQHVKRQRQKILINYVCTFYRSEFRCSSRISQVESKKYKENWREIPCIRSDISTFRISKQIFVMVSTNAWSLLSNVTILTLFSF